MVLVLLVAIIFGQTSLFKGDIASVTSECNIPGIGDLTATSLHCTNPDIPCSNGEGAACFSIKQFQGIFNEQVVNCKTENKTYTLDDKLQCGACLQGFVQSPTDTTKCVAEAAQTPTITTNIQATNGQNTIKVGDTFTFTASDVAESDMTINSSDASVITCKPDGCAAKLAGSSEIYASYLIWGTGEKILTNKINVLVEAAATGAQSQCLVDGTYYSDTGCLNPEQSCNREEIDNKEGCISPTELGSLLQEINSCKQGWISGGGPCCAEGTQLEASTNTCKTAVIEGSAESSTGAAAAKISSTPAGSDGMVKILVGDGIILIAPALERGWGWNAYDTTLLRCGNRGDPLASLFCVATGAGTTDVSARIDSPTVHNSNVIRVVISPKEVAAEIPANEPAAPANLALDDEPAAPEPASAPAATSCTVDGYEFGDPSCTSASPCLVNGTCMSIPALEYIGAQIELCTDDNAANANPNPGATWNETNLRCVCTAQGETWNGSTCTGGETRPSAESAQQIADLTERNRQLEQTIYWLNVQIEDARSRNDNISLEELLALLAQAKADQAAGRPSSVIVNFNAPTGSGLDAVLSTGGSVAAAAAGSSGETSVSEASVAAQQVPEIGKTLKAKAKKASSSIASKQTLSNSDLIRIAEEEAAKRAEGGSLAYQTATGETDIIKIAEEEAAKRAERGTGSLVASYVQGSTQSSSADTAASLSGGVIRGNSGPELLLYPILVGLANGAYFITRKKKKK